MGAHNILIKGNNGTQNRPHFRQARLCFILKADPYFFKDISAYKIFIITPGYALSSVNRSTRLGSANYQIILYSFVLQPNTKTTKLYPRMLAWCLGSTQNNFNQECIWFDTTSETGEGDRFAVKKCNQSGLRTMHYHPKHGWQPLANQDPLTTLWIDPSQTGALAAQIGSMFLVMWSGVKVPHRICWTQIFPNLGVSDLNPSAAETWARFLSLAWSKLRLCSANHRTGYWSNLSCDCPSTAWANSEHETENEPRIFWAH